MAEQEGVAQVEAAEVREEAQEATQPTQQEAQEALLHQPQAEAVQHQQHQLLPTRLFNHGRQLLEELQLIFKAPEEAVEAILGQVQAVQEAAFQDMAAVAEEGLTVSQVTGLWQMWPSLRSRQTA